MSICTSPRTLSRDDKSSDSGFAGNERFDSYVLQKMLGRGHYGTAHLAYSKEDKQNWVIKQIWISSLSHHERDDALREVEVLSQLHHSCVVAYKESFFYPREETLCIVMEYCDGGDLGQQISKRQSSKNYFSEVQIMEWITQIALGLEHCHHKRILHRDMKSQNIFLDRNHICKLGDFGIARVLDSTCEMAMSVVGTPYTMSPELCQSKPYSFKSDIWGFGCIIYELCMLQHAFQAENFLSLVWTIVRDNAHPIPSFYSEELKSLVSSMLSKDPDMRPNIDQIINTPIIHRQIMKKMYQLAEELNFQRNLEDIPDFDSDKNEQSEEHESSPKEKMIQRRRLLQEHHKKQLAAAAANGYVDRIRGKNRAILEFHGSGDILTLSAIPADTNLLYKTSNSSFDSTSGDPVTPSTYSHIPLDTPSLYLPSPKPAVSPKIKIRKVSTPSSLPPNRHFHCEKGTDEIDRPKSSMPAPGRAVSPTLPTKKYTPYLSKSSIHDMDNLDNFSKSETIDIPEEFNDIEDDFDNEYDEDFLENISDLDEESDSILQYIKPLLNDMSIGLKRATTIESHDKKLNEVILEEKETLRALPTLMSPTMPDKIKIIREKWIEKCGKIKFIEIYDFFKGRLNELDPSPLSVDTLRNKFGEDCINVSKAVEQLCFYENMLETTK